MKATTIENDLRDADASFSQAVRKVQIALSRISDAESEIAAARKETAVYEGYTAAIYHLSLTPLLNEFPQVRAQLIAALESELELRCRTKKQ